LKILFDQGVPKPLQPHLAPHEVHRAFQMGWAQKKNGELLALAEAAGFDVLVTTDQSLRYQQNLGNRKLAVFVLSRANWPQIMPYAAEIASKIKAIRKPGLYFCTVPPSAC
jgi:hypothetical protein